MSERYYCDHPIQGDCATLAGSEAHHLLHVMRATLGEQVTLFDGSGVEFRAEITSTSRSGAELAILDRVDVDRELPFHLTVAAALPKGDRQKWLVEKLTELGVSRLVPLVTTRSVAEPTFGATTRLQRSVIEACKQCGRNRLMTIAESTPWEKLVGIEGCASRWLAHPTGMPLSSQPSAFEGGIVIAVGPEGGFSDQEVEFARNSGWHIVSLGTRILRVETAAVALAAAVTLAK